MWKLMTVAWLAAGLAAFGWGASVIAGETASSAENMTLVGTYDEDGAYRTGTDMAFWGDLAVVGHLDQGTGPNATPPGGFRLLDLADPANPQLVGRFRCLGDQSDVSVWGDIVVLSVDKPTKANCVDGPDWEGVRIISIADRANPQLLATVPTDCGSHTNTIYPDLANERLVVYVLSYPLAGRYNPAGALPTCNAATHGKISVLTVPLLNPGAAKFERHVSVRPTIGCHDVTVFMERRLAAAACLTESQLWDLSDPLKPEIVEHIPNPTGMNLAHSTVFSNDGRTLVIGDELGGAAASPGCVTRDQRYVSGGLFFFDVSEVGASRLEGTFKLPREVISQFCTAHLFNVVPLRTEKDILVSSWYTGATSVIDFTEPSQPREIAHYVPKRPVTPDQQPAEAAGWASYWYRGHVYSNNFDAEVNSAIPRSRGLDVFTIDHEAVSGAVPLPRLNPQLQEPLPEATTANRARKPKKTKRRRAR